MACSGSSSSLIMGEFRRILSMRQNRRLGDGQYVAQLFKWMQERIPNLRIFGVAVSRSRDMVNPSVLSLRPGQVIVVDLQRRLPLGLYVCSSFVNLSGDTR